MTNKRIAIYIRLSRADGQTGLSKDESESVVNQRSLINGFLDRHPEFCPVPGKLPNGEPFEADVTLWPQRHGTDGFYICRMKKEKAYD